MLIAILLALLPIAAPAPAPRLEFPPPPDRGWHIKHHHEPRAPVVRRPWEVRDADGCVTRPLLGPRNDGTIRICG